MQELFIGNCCLCPKQIYDFKKLPLVTFNNGSLTFNFKPVPYALNKDGATFFVLLTDSSRMEISICKDCLSKLTDEQVKKVFADIIYTKLKRLEKENMKDEVRYKMFDRIRTLEIWSWAKCEQNIIDYLKGKNEPQHCSKQS